MIRALAPFALLIALLSQPVSAAYITDKLLVGLYGSANSISKPIKILSSGTRISILERQGGFIKVKLKDSTVGWVERRYVTDDQPAGAKLSLVQAKAKRLEKDLKKTKDELAKLKKNASSGGAKSKKLEKELAEVRKQNAEFKETIKRQDDIAKDLEKKIQESQSGYALKKYQAQVDELEAKLLQSQVRLARRTQKDDSKIHAENEAMRERMQQAAKLLNIDPNADIAPATEEEPAGSGMPIWVYPLILLTLITGIVAGFALFDYRSRSRYSVGM